MFLISWRFLRSHRSSRIVWIFLCSLNFCLRTLMNSDPKIYHIYEDPPPWAYAKICKKDEDRKKFFRCRLPCLQMSFKRSKYRNNVIQNHIFEGEPRIIFFMILVLCSLFYHFHMTFSSRQEGEFWLAPSQNSRLKYNWNFLMNCFVYSEFSVAFL